MAPSRRGRSATPKKGEPSLSCSLAFSPSTAEPATKPTISRISTPHPKASRSRSRPAAARQEEDGGSSAGIDFLPGHLPGTFGFRTFVAVVGCLPMFYLLLMVPVEAYLGVLVYPDILVSDAIAKDESHRSMYSTGISMAGVSSIVIYSEMIREIKRRVSLLPKGQTVPRNFIVACDQFLFTVLSVVVPNLLVLISFLFDENDAPWSQTGNLTDSTELALLDNDCGADRNAACGGASISPTPPHSEYGFSTLLHIIAATLCFLGLAVCAFLYAFHIAPICYTLNLEPHIDTRIRTVCAVGIAVTVAIGGPVRLLHIYDRQTWSIPMMLVEVIALLFGVTANVFGSANMMMNLDANQPKIVMSHILPWEFWGTLIVPFFALTNFWSVDGVLRRGKMILAEAEKKGFQLLREASDAIDEGKRRLQSSS